MARTDHQLRRARVERGLTIEQVVEASRLPTSTAIKIDEGRFDELPAGVYARSYVRTFAAVVGVEPERALDELATLLPPTPDPFPVLRELKGASPRRPRRNGSLSRWPDWSVLRCDAWSLPRWIVAGIDALMLLAINAIVVWLTAYISGLPIAMVLQHASTAVAVVCAVPMTMYFVLFEGIAGRTPGAMVCRVPQLPAGTPLGLRTILLRAFGSGFGSGARPTPAARLSTYA
jgi:hypothetical protein